MLAITDADKQLAIVQPQQLVLFLPGSLSLAISLTPHISLCVIATDPDTNNFSLFISAPRSSSRSILLSGNKVLKRYTRPIRGVDNCPASFSAVRSFVPVLYHMCLVLSDGRYLGMTLY